MHVCQFEYCISLLHAADDGHKYMQWKNKDAFALLLKNDLQLRVSTFVLFKQSGSMRLPLLYMSILLNIHP